MNHDIGLEEGKTKIKRLLLKHACRDFIQIHLQGERGKRASYKNISCFPVRFRQLCYVRKSIGYMASSMPCRINQGSPLHNILLFSHARFKHRRVHYYYC